MAFPKFIRPTIGRKKYTVLRDDGLGGGYVDGEWVDAGRKEVVIRANIQPAFQGYLTKLMDQGDRDKQAIFVSSLDYVFTAQSNVISPKEPDYIRYNGALWEVKYEMPYQNVGVHTEHLAIKIPESERERIEGMVFGRT